ncbi:RNA polymerase sigma factor [Paludifilum halophilum]|uniref:RNA polymerase sigma-70 region 4 domain-containing protein n=1 Tax=Paludifilum halophilum TaxID=1642702 RepID=A0A235B889_9BACL|nr:sigma factor-like helix-turn-helix DNA-binding protein [Paludifilum halophilum]OYD08528.1 hypothetical protein CHM34_06795 [Paludifilum halophilum]
MGKGADITSANKRNDDDFPYEAVGVLRLLKEINRLDARLVPGADYDTAVILQDLRDALDSPVLTARQRQVVALYFFTDSTMEEAAGILSITKGAIKLSLNTSLERIAAQMKAEEDLKFRGRAVKPFDSRRPLFVWLNAVAAGEVPAYEIPDEANEDLLAWYAENGDELAQEVLRQRVEGPPVVVEVYENPEDEYPCLNPRQMQYREKMQVPVGDVKPQFDVAGSRMAARRVADKENEHDFGNEWSIGKKQIFVIP